MSTVAQFVDQVDGVSDGVADDLTARYDSVADLARAEPADLEQVKGVGPVLADRILQAARAEAPAAMAEESAEPLAQHTEGAVRQTAEAARPVLGVVGDAAGDAASGRTAEVDADPELPTVVVRLATWVGTTLGWTVRAYRSVTTPVARLLRRA